MFSPGCGVGGDLEVKGRFLTAQRDDGMEPNTSDVTRGPYGDSSRMSNDAVLPRKSHDDNDGQASGESTEDASVRDHKPFPSHVLQQFMLQPTSNQDEKTNMPPNNESAYPFVTNKTRNISTTKHPPTERPADFRPSVTNCPVLNDVSNRMDSKSHRASLSYASQNIGYSNFRCNDGMSQAFAEKCMDMNKNFPRTVDQMNAKCGFENNAWKHSPISMDTSRHSFSSSSGYTTMSEEGLSGHPFVQSPPYPACGSSSIGTPSECPPPVGNPQAAPMDINYHRHLHKVAHFINKPAYDLWRKTYGPDLVFVTKIGQLCFAVIKRGEEALVPFDCIQDAFKYDLAPLLWNSMKPFLPAEFDVIKHISPCVRTPCAVLYEHAMVALNRSGWVLINGTLVPYLRRSDNISLVPYGLVRHISPHYRCQEMGSVECENIEMQFFNNMLYSYYGNGMSVKTVRYRELLVPIMVLQQHHRSLYRLPLSITNVDLHSFNYQHHPVAALAAATESKRVAKNQNRKAVNPIDVSPEWTSSQKMNSYFGQKGTPPHVIAPGNQPIPVKHGPLMSPPPILMPVSREEPRPPILDKALPCPFPPSMPSSQSADHGNSGISTDSGKPNRDQSANENPYPSARRMEDPTTTEIQNLLDADRCSISPIGDIGDRYTHPVPTRASLEGQTVLNIEPLEIIPQKVHKSILEKFRYIGWLGVQGKYVPYAEDHSGTRYVPLAVIEGFLGGREKYRVEVFEGVLTGHFNRMLRALYDIELQRANKCKLMSVEDLCEEYRKRFGEELCVTKVNDDEMERVFLQSQKERAAQGSVGLEYVLSGEDLLATTENGMSKSQFRIGTKGWLIINDRANIPYVNRYGSALVPRILIYRHFKTVGRHAIVRVLCNMRETELFNQLLISDFQEASVKYRTPLILADEVVKIVEESGGHVVIKPVTSVATDNALQRSDGNENIFQTNDLGTEYQHDVQGPPSDSSMTDSVPSPPTLIPIIPDSDFPLPPPALSEPTPYPLGPAATLTPFAPPTLSAEHDARIPPVRYAPASSHAGIERIYTKYDSSYPVTSKEYLEPADVPGTSGFKETPMQKLIQFEQRGVSSTLKSTISPPPPKPKTVKEALLQKLATSANQGTKKKKKVKPNVSTKDVMDALIQQLLTSESEEKESTADENTDNAVPHHKQKHASQETTQTVAQMRERLSNTSPLKMDVMANMIAPFMETKLTEIKPKTEPDACDGKPVDVVTKHLQSTSHKPKKVNKPKPRKECDTSLPKPSIANNGQLIEILDSDEARSSSTSASVSAPGRESANVPAARECGAVAEETNHLLAKGKWNVESIKQFLQSKCVYPSPAKLSQPQQDLVQFSKAQLKTESARSLDPLPKERHVVPVDDSSDVAMHSVDTSDVDHQVGSRKKKGGIKRKRMSMGESSATANQKKRRRKSLKTSALIKMQDNVIYLSDDEKRVVKKFCKRNPHVDMSKELIVPIRDVSIDHDISSHSIKVEDIDVKPKLVKLEKGSKLSTSTDKKGKKRKMFSPGNFFRIALNYAPSETDTETDQKRRPKSKAVRRLGDKLPKKRGRPSKQGGNVKFSFVSSGPSTETLEGAPKIDNDHQETVVPENKVIKSDHADQIIDSVARGDKEETSGSLKLLPLSHLDEVINSVARDANKKLKKKRSIKKEKSAKLKDSPPILASYKDNLMDELYSKGPMSNESVTSMQCLKALDLQIKIPISEELAVEAVSMVTKEYQQQNKLNDDSKAPSESPSGEPVKKTNECDKLKEMLSELDEISDKAAESEEHAFSEEDMKRDASQPNPLTILKRKSSSPALKASIEHVSKLLKQVIGSIVDKDTGKPVVTLVTNDAAKTENGLKPYYMDVAVSNVRDECANIYEMVEESVVMGTALCKEPENDERNVGKGSTELEDSPVDAGQQQKENPVEMPKNEECIDNAEGVMKSMLHETEDGKSEESVSENNTQSLSDKMMNPKYMDSHKSDCSDRIISTMFGPIPEGETETILHEHVNTKKGVHDADDRNTDIVKPECNEQQEAQVPEITAAQNSNNADDMESVEEQELSKVISKVTKRDENSNVTEATVTAGAECDKDASMDTEAFGDAKDTTIESKSDGSVGSDCDSGVQNTTMKDKSVDNSDISKCIEDENDAKCQNESGRRRDIDETVDRVSNKDQDDQVDIMVADRSQNESDKKIIDAVEFGECVNGTQERNNIDYMEMTPTHDIKSLDESQCDVDSKDKDASARQNAMNLSICDNAISESAESSTVVSEPPSSVETENADPTDPVNQYTNKSAESSALAGDKTENTNSLDSVDQCAMATVHINNLGERETSLKTEVDESPRQIALAVLLELIGNTIPDIFMTAKKLTINSLKSITSESVHDPMETDGTESAYHSCVAQESSSQATTDMDTSDAVPNEDTEAEPMSLATSKEGSETDYMTAMETL